MRSITEINCPDQGYELTMAQLDEKDSKIEELDNTVINLTKEADMHVNLRNEEKKRYEEEKQLLDNSSETIQTLYEEAFSRIDFCMNWLHSSESVCSLIDTQLATQSTPNRFTAKKPKFDSNHV